MEDDLANVPSMPPLRELSKSNRPAPVFGLPQEYTGSPLGEVGHQGLFGSYNLDPRSEKLNSETAVVFESDILSAELAEIFYENDLANSRHVTPEDAEGFNELADAFYKLRKEFGGLFESLL